MNGPACVVAIAQWHSKLYAGMVGEKADGLASGSVGKYANTNAVYVLDAHRCVRPYG